MANPWFRMHAEFAHDPKVQMMPETLQRRFLMLMCMRCGNDSETFHDDEVMFQLRISDEEAARTKAVFIAKGFIDEQWRLVNWEKRQYLSDSSTERVREHRERQKQDAKTHVTERNVSVTAPDTEQNRTETEQITVKPLPADKRQAATGVDDRHAAFRAQVHAYWHHRHSTEELAPWDGSEAKALARLLKAKPDLTPERFKQLLHCRERSEVNHDERPRAWLERLTDYAGGPLDRFKQPAPAATSQPGVSDETLRSAELAAEARRREAELQAARPRAEVEAEHEARKAEIEAQEAAREADLGERRRNSQPLSLADRLWLNRREYRVKSRQATGAPASGSMGMHLATAQSAPMQAVSA